MKQIVCLSNEAWSHSPGRTQQLITRLKHTQVLFFSPSGSWREIRFRAKGRAVKPNITVYPLPPLLLPADERYGPLFRLEQLRLAAFDPTEFPDTESYLWQLRSNFIRMTDRDCVLPEHGLEEQARVLFGELAKIGALEVLENG